MLPNFDTGVKRNHRFFIFMLELIGLPSEGSHDNSEEGKCETNNFSSNKEKCRIPVDSFCLHSQMETFELATPKQNLKAKAGLMARATEMFRPPHNRTVINNVNFMQMR